MAKRHTFSNSELDQYFDRISLPAEHRTHNVTPLTDDQKLSFLNTLQKHHLIKVPWENLTQHYSWHHVVNVKPKHLFNKIVNNPGRGGYCMEANYFFHLILHSLDFSTYMCGSRIYKGSKTGYGGWTHVVNIVTIAGTKYLLDSGLGSAGPTAPIPLLQNHPQNQIAPAQSRLIYEPIPENLNQSMNLWIYQQRFTPSSDWKTQYCFPDLEFIPADITSMNFEPALNPATFFTHKVVAVRFTSASESDPPYPSSPSLDGPIDGSIALVHNTLKWRRSGKKIVDLELKTEEERVQALKTYFGITLAEEEIDGILGTAAQIGETGPGQE